MFVIGRGRFVDVVCCLSARFIIAVQLARHGVCLVNLFSLASLKYYLISSPLLLNTF